MSNLLIRNLKSSDKNIKKHNTGHSKLGRGVRHLRVVYKKKKKLYYYLSSLFYCPVRNINDTTKDTRDIYLY